LYNLLLKAIGTQDTDRQREFNEMIRPLLTVLEDCDTLDSVQRTIQEVFSGLCRAMGGHRREERLAQDVRSYIMENFRNVNLNIGLISDHFNLSQGYLSKLFKESTDESLLDYIARVRVAQAKQILEAGRRSLEDIAVEVGYMNSNSLIRAFKKQEGVTPGKYRML
jgi:YesN/AraC family two-component response regulator